MMLWKLAPIPVGATNSSTPLPGRPRGLMIELHSRARLAGIRLTARQAMADPLCDYRSVATDGTTV